MSTFRDKTYIDLSNIATLLTKANTGITTVSSDIEDEASARQTADSELQESIEEIGADNLSGGTVSDIVNGYDQDSSTSVSWTLLSKSSSSSTSFGDGVVSSINELGNAVVALANGTDANVADLVSWASSNTISDDDIEAAVDEYIVE